MKVINPFHVSEVEQFAENNAATIKAHLEASGGKREISFDELRAAFPSVKDPRTGKAPISDGAIAAVFEYLGYEVTQ